MRTHGLKNQDGYEEGTKKSSIRGKCSVNRPPRPSLGATDPSILCCQYLELKEPESYAQLSLSLTDESPDCFHFRSD